MKEVVKKEVVKLLDAGIIYPISNSAQVCPVQVVSKKGGIAVVKNENNELIPTRTVTGWRMCIDYQKLNNATPKDHFPLHFMDQMLERIAGHAYYCFLDGYSGYNQIHIALEDQEKTTSPALIGYLLIGGCYLVCAMHQLPFRDACQPFSKTWWRDSLRFLWMIFQFLVLHLRVVYIIYLWS